MYFFFFQAEDGIRDGRVTGVQTCALPIFAKRNPMHQVSVPHKGAKAFNGPKSYSLSWRKKVTTEEHWVPQSRLLRKTLWRSEERRVGKECRSRWSPDH